MKRQGFSEIAVGTTASGADRIATMSLNIRESGHARPAEVPRRSPKHLCRLVLYLEALLNLGDQGLGSQIVAKAARNN